MEWVDVIIVGTWMLCGNVWVRAMMAGTWMLCGNGWGRRGRCCGWGMDALAKRMKSERTSIRSGHGCSAGRDGCAARRDEVEVYAVAVPLKI